MSRRLEDIQEEIRKLEDELDELNFELEESNVVFENWDGDYDYAMLPTGNVVNINEYRDPVEIEVDIKINKKKIKELEEEWMVVASEN